MERGKGIEWRQGRNALWEEGREKSGDRGGVVYGRREGNRVRTGEKCFIGGGKGIE